MRSWNLNQDGVTDNFTLDFHTDDINIFLLINDVQQPVVNKDQTAIEKNKKERHQANWAWKFQVKSWNDWIDN